MFQPRKVKFLKQHKLKFRGNKYNKAKLKFGIYGIQSLETSYITVNQIEAVRKILKNYIRPFGKLWILIYPFKPITQVSEGSRMGSGKGNVNSWVSLVKTGQIIFEIDNLSLSLVKEASSLISNKLPIKIRLITK